MNGVEGFMYPNESRSAVERADRFVSVHHGAGGGRIHPGFAGAGLPRGSGQADIPPGAAHSVGFPARRAAAAAFLHLGHPERSPEMYFTPHATSAMAMFGYVYLWYLMAVLVFEIWLDYRRDIVLLLAAIEGPAALGLQVMTLGSSNISERSLHIDEKVGWIVTLIGIPSAFLLHGYVGFIFGSIKANPWWSSPLMPVVFIFSAMVSGVAAVMLIYMAITKLRKQTIDIRCVDAIAMYMFYIFIIDFSLEMLDLIHRIYEADESFRSLDFMVHTKLFFSQIVLQICFGHARAAGSAVPDAGGEAQRDRPQTHLCYLRLPDSDQRLCHALERGDRRATLLQEFSWLHHLQDGPGDAAKACWQPSG